MNDPKNLDDAFESVCKEMQKIFVRKHRDYGKGNIMDTGELGIAFRINDKLNRLKHILSANKHPDNESMEESWIDIAVYAVIAIMFLRGWFQKLHLKRP